MASSMTMSRGRLLTGVLVAAAFSVALPDMSRADEGGASLYLPGSYASMAAAPGAPGWSAGLSYFHAKAALRTASERTDLAYGALNYAFATPVLGGQLALGVAGALGRMSVAVIGTGRDSRLGAMDLTPSAALRWNTGVHNVMVYTQINAPTGTYNQPRLANFGINHWGQDSGLGYTFFDKDSGYEFSAVAGATWNGQNKATRYRNGADVHVDFAASKFFPNNIQLGVAGYYYQQITDDRGPGAALAGKARVIALGPQAGYLFPVGDQQGYVNVRAYREFAAANRPAGWNMWVTFVLSPRSP